MTRLCTVWELALQIVKESLSQYLFIYITVKGEVLSDTRVKIMIRPLHSTDETEILLLIRGELIFLTNLHLSTFPLSSTNICIFYTIYTLYIFYI